MAPLLAPRAHIAHRAGCAPRRFRQLLDKRVACRPYAAPPSELRGHQRHRPSNPHRPRSSRPASMRRCRSGTNGTCRPAADESERAPAHEGVRQLREGALLQKRLAWVPPLAAHATVRLQARSIGEASTLRRSSPLEHPSAFTHGVGARRAAQTQWRVIRPLCAVRFSPLPRSCSCARSPRRSARSRRRTGSTTSSTNGLVPHRAG